MKRILLGLSLGLVHGSIAVAEWVQWDSGAGHNGHFYRAVALTGGIVWSNANRAAEAAGGYLASINSMEENAFVFTLVDSEAYWVSNFGPWIGGVQPSKTSEPAGAWAWTSGEAWGFTRWASGQPDNHQDAEEYAHYYTPGAGRASTWNDFNGSQVYIRSYVIERKPPAIAAIHRTGANILLELDGLIAGWTSCVQRATTMTTPNWTNQNPFLAASSRTNISDTATLPTQMYRVLQY